MTESIPNPENSILDSTKKMLGMGADYDVFDLDIMIHINSVFSTLQQLGIGPTQGFSISGPEEEWSTFLGASPLLNNVRSYMVLKVKLLFDPPPNSFTQESMKQQVQELEWRMNVQRETTDWVDPNPVPVAVIDPFE